VSSAPLDAIDTRAAILAGDMLMALEVQAPGEAGNERG